MTSEQIQRIYGMAAVLGLVDNGNPPDDLHLLIESRTGKTSVKQLTDGEYKIIVRELSGMLPQNLDVPPCPPKQKRDKHYDETPGQMTAAQQKKVWQLMYRLKALDVEETTASLGSRLCGIIKITFGVDAAEKDPMKWLSAEQGGRLIEKIKQYVKSAERKAMRGG